MSDTSTSPMVTRSKSQIQNVSNLVGRVTRSWTLKASLPVVATAQVKNSPVLNRKRKYAEKYSPEKEEINDEVAAWIWHGYKPGKTIWFLDGPGLRTFHAVSGVGVLLKDLVIVESNADTFLSQAEQLPRAPGHFHGDVFERLERVLANGLPGEVPYFIWMDLMVAYLSDHQLLILKQWVSKCKTEHPGYHALWITLTTRKTRGHKASDVSAHVVKSLTTREFGLHTQYPYQRSGRVVDEKAQDKDKKPGSTTMDLLMFGTEPPKNPLYRPHKLIRQRTDGFWVVKWYGSGLTSIECSDSDAVRLLQEP